MKTIKTVLLCLTWLSICQLSNAQPPVREPDMGKPLLFSNLPSQLDCRLSVFQNLLNASEQEEVSVEIATGFRMEGIISSKAVKDNGQIRSVVLRSTNYPGAVMSLAWVQPQDGPAFFTGRIISHQHGDSYEITHENGVYKLTRKGYYDLVNE